MAAVAAAGAVAGVAGGSPVAALLAAGCAGLAGWAGWRRRIAPGAGRAGSGREFDRLRAVAATVRQGLLLVDETGDVVLANTAARRDLRDPAIDPIGAPLWQCLPPALADLARRMFDQIRRDGAAAAPARGKGVARGERMVHLLAVPVYTAAGGAPGGAAFLLDDSTVGEELVRLKDRLLSGISHELRTPLTNMCAYSEILRNVAPVGSAQWPEFARIVHEESLRLADLVDCVFDYAQIQEGDVSWVPDVIDATALVGDVVERMREHAASRGIDLQASLGGTANAVAFDRRRFRQVCDQLIGNALKFTPRDGAVHVTAGVCDGRFSLRVEDSGPGVPEKDRAAVFETFVQLNDQLTDKPTGTGLGLAAAQALVVRQGGHIWCEDADLGGAAFCVSLPLLPTFGAAAGRAEAVGAG